MIVTSPDEEPLGNDGVLNGTESAIDCGGSCSKCADGATCGTGLDCKSGVWVWNTMIACGA